MLKDAPIIPYIPVTDLARARTFYRDIIGLEPSEEVNGGLMYECGGTRIFMYISGGAGTSKASQAFWPVEDVKAEVAALTARGLKFEEYDMPGMKTVGGIATAGDTMAAWFKDSEGNIMAIVQQA